jgi:hypothetical protein
LFLNIYELGGITVVSPGLLRNVKNPTAMGTRIIRTVKHSNTYPITGENVCGVVTPLFVTSIGEPLAIRNPHMQVNMLAQPQASADTTVATMPRVLFCIFCSYRNVVVRSIVPLTQGIQQMITITRRAVLVR